MDKKKTNPLISKLLWFEENFMALIVLGVTVLLFVNVLLRYFSPLAHRYGFPLPTFSWAEEAIRYCLIWVTFIAAANAFRRESHFGVDLIFRVKSVKLVKFIRLLNDIGCFIFCGFILYYGVKMVVFNMGGGQISPALKVPLWIVYMVIPISGGLSMAYIVRNFIRKLITPAEILYMINNTPKEGA